MIEIQLGGRVHFLACEKSGVQVPWYHKKKKRKKEEKKERKKEEKKERKERKKRKERKS